MESTTVSKSMSLSWKLLVILPLAVSVLLAVMGSRQTDLHAEIELNTIAGLFGNAALMVLAVHWIVVNKLIGVGILILIVASTALGFGLHTLLRVW